MPQHARQTYHTTVHMRIERTLTRQPLVTYTTHHHARNNKTRVSMRLQILAKTKRNKYCVSALNVPGVPIAGARGPKARGLTSNDNQFVLRHSPAFSCSTP